MFRIELDDKDGNGVLDLVELMARQAGAAFSTRLILETENERLANAVGALLGRLVVSDRKTSPRFLEPSVVTAGEQTTEPIEPEPEKKFSDWRKCEFCGEPATLRGKTCGRPECDRQLKKKHNQAYKARRSAGSLYPDDQEAAPSELPFEITRTLRILGGSLDGMTYPGMTIVGMIQKGTLAEGQQVQDLMTLVVYQLSASGEMTALATPGRILLDPVPGAERSQKA